MPRTPRVDAPGCLHHVVVRGIERRHIFRDELDRRDLLNRLDRILPETGASCYAWALMPNHVHLVLRTGQIPIATVMARVNTGYAIRFNRRHARAGYLFQNRYHAFLVESDAYLLTLVRYVHLNPLRAGIVDSLAALERHPWTGHAALMGKTATRFQDSERILAHFGGTTKEARRRLIEWMRDQAEIPEPPRLPEAEAPRATVAEAAARVSPAMAPHPAHVRREGMGRSVSPNTGLAELIGRVCLRRGVAMSDVLARRKCRPAVDARAEIAFRAGIELGLSGVEIARGLGLSTASVSQARMRGRALLDSAAATLRRD
jgi:REP element-mobilizing transposase RayT